METSPDLLLINPDEWHYQAHLTFTRDFGEASVAIDRFKQALRINPNSADAYSNLGVALAQIGQISEAVEQVEAALRINPNDIDARNNLTKLETLQENHAGEDQALRR